ncbi:hypothetical protein niasHS_014702 [Heterodera schachtii]|uniref:RBR-type E3 ubiquitin transferase n=1 Tax=Heterodera schachtii TaxID=97005 RepID=A0ABD2IM54_HETSC
MACAGGHILRDLALIPENLLKLLREPGDDLEFAYRLYQLTFNKKGKKLLNKLCHNSPVKIGNIMQIAEMASELATNYSSNCSYIEHRRIDEDCRAFRPVDLRNVNKFGFLVISALSYAFCQAFDENICNFYDIYGDGKGFFYNPLLGCTVTLCENSFARQTDKWPKINQSRIVSYSFSKTTEDKNGMLEAFFVCRLPISLIHQYPITELNQFKINIGPMVAEKLLSSDFVNNLCEGDLASFQGYNPATGLLSIACSARSALKLRQLTDGTVNSLFELLNTMDKLRWFDEESGALISFGPGFQISQLNANPSEREKDTIVVSFIDSFEHFEPMVHQLTEFSLQFCESRNCKPLLFTDCKSRRCFVTLLAPSIINDLKSSIDSLLQFFPGVSVETRPGNISEYFAGYNAIRSSGSVFDNSSYPTDCCAICFGTIDGQFIRLSLCGHVYCDDCFIGLLKNAIQFPVSCQSGCLYQILFEDIALIFSRNFRGVDEIQQFLTPVFRLSLHSFLLAHRDEFVRCQSEGCHCLMPLSKGTANGAVGSPMICFGCKMKRCTLCGEAVHQEITCQERQEQKFSIEHPDLSAWKNELPSHRRLCPNVHCKMLIEKGPGCNHMYCKQCGVHFCWLCINFQAGTTEEVYKHLREVHRSIGEPGFVDEVHLHFGQLVEQFGYERAAAVMNVEVAPDGHMLTDPFYAQAMMVIDAFSVYGLREDDEETGDDAEREDDNPLHKYRDNWTAMFNRFKKDLDGHVRRDN